MHLIYRASNYEGHSKDYDFSRASMQEHWRAGYHDAVRTLRHPEVLERPTNHDGVFTFDLSHDGRNRNADKRRMVMSIQKILDRNGAEVSTICATETVRSAADRIESAVSPRWS